MKWIKSSERLPGTDQKMVLVSSEEYGVEIAWFITHKDGYYFCIGSDVKQTWQPKYWLPIPESPKEEN